MVVYVGNNQVLKKINANKNREVSTDATKRGIFLTARKNIGEKIHFVQICLAE